MNQRIRWGILGTGRIARKFAASVATLPDAELAAVGSRSAAAAEEFGSEFQIARRHDTYEALAEDPGIDAVYVATPNSRHAADMSLCLAAGKAVLGEKPFTINVREAEAVFALAQARKLLVMEAMWTRFLPLVGEMQAMIREGAIGEPRGLQAEIGWRAEVRTGRLFEPALGGGALLDAGIYPISLASLLFGMPSEIAGTAEIGPTGVDEEFTVSLGHAGGQRADFLGTFRRPLSLEATITGTAGQFRIHAPWWKASRMTWTRGNGQTELIERPYASHGLQFEAAAFANAWRAGQLECAVMPWAETRAIMRTLDTLRKQWGLRYPME